MITNILTPLDGSEHAQAALAFSADLAARYGARLDLLHVCDPSAADLGPEAGGRDLDTQGAHLLSAAQSQAGARGVADVETILEHGDAAKRILFHAKERATDLIVMGSRGLGGFAQLALGSVSHKVFHLSPCSCVMIHQEGDLSSDGGPKRILVPTDGSEAADRAVDLASDLANRYGAELVLLYVMWRGPSLEQLRGTVDLDRLSKPARDELDPSLHPVAEHVSASFIPPVVSRDALREIGEQVLERSGEAAKAKGVAAPKSIILDTEPARGIVNTAKREEADLVVIGSRGLSGLEGVLAGSVSYKVLHSAPVSSIVVR